MTTGSATDGVISSVEVELSGVYSEIAAVVTVVDGLTGLDVSVEVVASIAATLFGLISDITTVVFGITAKLPIGRSFFIYPCLTDDTNPIFPDALLTGILPKVTGIVAQLVLTVDGVVGGVLAIVNQLLGSSGLVSEVEYVLVGLVGSLLGGVLTGLTGLVGSLGL